VIRQLRTVLDIIVVVAAEGQDLPSLDASVRLVRDQYSARGPIEGVRRGLSALPEPREYAFVTGCDLPLLRPALIQGLLGLRHGFESVVAVDAGLRYPLPAVYRKSLTQVAHELLSRGENRLGALAGQGRLREVDLESLREFDAELDSFRNVNTPADYSSALRRVGLPT
jgi:molybdopterin-guanine dinucleotide biosynthesis protein A